MSGAPTIVSRRAVLAGTGALVFSFCASPRLLAQDAATPPGAQPLPGSLKQTPFLDSWIRIDAGGAITICTGKAELGQGITTALLQIAAEQFDADLGQLKVISADTALTPNEGYTSGSHSLQDSGTAILNAAAQVRQILVAEAARRAGLPADQMKTENSAVVAPDGRRFGYGELVAAELLHVQAAPQPPLKPPAEFKIMGRPIARLDIPAKVTGGAAYVQDLRPDGMVHGRVVRPPSYGATLAEIDTAAVEKMPSVLKMVRDGSFLGVIAEREFAAIEAMRALAAAARWQETAKLPDAGALPALLTSLPSRDTTVLDRPGPGAGSANRATVPPRRRSISTK